MSNINSGISGVFNFLKSLKLTVVSISVLIGLLIISAILPQNLNLQTYTESFGFLGYMFYRFGLTSIRSSLVFLLFVYLFLINLITCSGYKIYRQSLGGEVKILGSDIIHLGVLLIVISALMNLYLGFNKSGLSSDFKSSNLPENIINNLESDVESPIRSGFYTLTHLSETEVYFVTLSNNGTFKRVTVDNLTPFVIGEDKYQLKKSFNDYALFYYRVGSGTIRINRGDRLGNYTLLETSSSIFKGVRISYTPGQYIFILGIIIFFTGLIITLLFKVKDGLK